MDLPLMIPRFLVRKMVSDAYKAGQLDQAREDARAVTDALKEAVNPQGLLLQRAGHRRSSCPYPSRSADTHIHPEPLPPLLRDDDCGDLVRSR